jgi:Secretion system C-terminal sorting domain
MKKIYLKLFVALFSICFFETNAQMSNYTFSSTSGAYTPISGGTVLNSGTGLDVDSIYANVPIGFNFGFDYQTYSQLSVSANGFVFFGEVNKGYRTSYKFSPLIAKTISFGLSTTGPAEGVIAALGFNYVSASAGAELRYQTLGSAPNRTFVVQWSNVKRSGDASMNANFQLILSETSNTIDIQYGACTAGSLTTGGNIGIRGGNVQDFQSRGTGATGVTWASSISGSTSGSFITYGTSAAVVPPTGLKYSYTPSFAVLPTPTYAALGSITNFDGTWITVKSAGDVPNNSWRSWPAFGNNSWRINTNTTGGWTTPTGGAPTVAAPAANEVARFHTNTASTNTNGVLDYYLNASANTNNKTLTFNYINVDGTDSLKILFSKNNGLSFVAVDSMGAAAAWTTKTVSLGNTDSARCVIRFSAYKTAANSSDIAIDNVSVTGATCSVPPIGGTASTSTISITSGQSITLNVAGQVGNIQWQDSTIGSASFTDIAGATTNAYNFQITRPGTYYYKNRANDISCPNDYSNIAVLTVTPITGDDACDAITLTSGLNGPFNLQYASAQVNEVIPPSGGLSTSQTTWSGTVTNPLKNTRTMWFKFIAPASKKVRLAANFAGLINNDTQLALWDINNCSQLTTSGGGAILIAANDDSTGLLRNSFITDTVMCLTPGKTYYVQVDPYSNSLSAPVYVRLEEVNSVNSNFSGLPTSACIGAGPFTLTPSVSGGLFSANVVGNSYTPSLNAGLDSVTYTLGGACSVSNKKYITINALPNVGAITSLPSVCTGQSVTFNGTGALTYTWTNGVINGLAFVPSSTNQYLVTGTDANGCTDTLTIGFTVFNNPSVSVAVTNSTICEGFNTTLTASGANTYVWDNSVLNGVSFIPANTATYTVIGTNTDGCKDTTSTTVVVNPKPIVNLGGLNQSTCNPNLTLDAGNAGSTYLWSDASTNQTLTVSTNGLYKVTVTSGAGCIGKDSANVTLNSVLIANLTPTTNSVCEGSPVINLVGSPAGGTYSANAVGGAFNPNTAGTFNVSYIVTNVCGTDTADASITVNGLPTVSASANDSSLCAGESVTLNGAGASTYVWDNGVANGIATTPSATTLYTVIGTDANGCTNTASLNIVVNPLPVASYTVSDPDTFCAKKPVTLTGTPAGGVFSMLQGAASSLTGFIFNPQTTGTYKVVYSYTDGNGCNDTAVKTFVITCVTGFESIAAKGITNVSIVPNPSNGVFEVQINNALSDNAIIKMMSFEGKVLAQTKHDLKQDNKIAMDINQYANGIYFVNINMNGSNKTVKIVKQ